MEQRQLNLHEFEKFAVFLCQWPAGHGECVLDLSEDEKGLIQSRGLAQFICLTERRQSLHPMARLAAMVYPVPTDANLEEVKWQLVEFFRKNLKDDTFLPRDLMAAIQTDPRNVARIVMNWIIQSDV